MHQEREQSNNSIENLVYWYMVLKFLLKDYDMTEQSLSTESDQHPAVDTSDFLH